MNSLIGRSIQKTTVSRSFSAPFSSLSILPKPQLPQHEPSQDHTSFLDPFRVIATYANSKHYTLSTTEMLHTHLLKTGVLHSTTFVSNSLLDWYCKSLATSHSEKLFDEMPERNVVSWNMMISGYSQSFRFEDSWELFCKMWGSGFQPNEVSCGSVIHSCGALGAPLLGRMVYSVVVKRGFCSDGHVRVGMIDLFAKCGLFEDALWVFGDGVYENVVTWNSIISGAVRNGENWAALDIFRSMCGRSLVPTSFTFSSVLTACASLGEIEIGKGVHGWVIKCSANDVFVGTALVDLYAKCGDMSEAVKEFSRMPTCNVVSWTAIISGFVRKGDSTSALTFFKEMRRSREDINSFTVTSVLTACAKTEMTKEAIQMHGWILKAGFNTDPVVAAALINTYSKMAAISLAETVFRELNCMNNPGIWAVMISSYAQDNDFSRASLLLKEMLQKGLRPDEISYASVLSVTNCFPVGREIHSHALKAGALFNISVCCSLSTMYSKCGSIEDSYKVFEQIPVKDDVSWTSMIAGFAEHGCVDEAFALFRDMLSEGTRPSQLLLTAVLTACSNIHSLCKSKEVHGYALRVGVGLEALVGGAVVASYSKCGALGLGRMVFDMLPEKDNVSCSSLISGCARNGLLEEAVFQFHEMLISKFSLDSFTISSVLYAVARLNRIGLGTQLHAHITKLGLDSNVSVGSSLVTMYSNCGSIEDCCKAFSHIRDPDLIGWTAMIASYAQHGKGTEGLNMYELMRQKGVRPDSVTFVAVLAACSRTHMVQEGYFYFDSMIKDFGIQPSNHHYACMVDLLGRSGKLKEAESLIKSMPIEPNALVWSTLLAACKVHGDVELGRVAAEKVMELNPLDSEAYVSFSNLSAYIGQWEEASKIRSLMKETGISKEPGWSLM